MNATAMISRNINGLLQLGHLLADESKQLTKRQCETALCAGNGLEQNETAQVLDCSRTNVKQLIGQAMNKTGATNTTHLVTRCFELGILRFASITFAWLMGLGLIVAPPANANTRGTETDDSQQRLRGSRRQPQARRNGRNFRSVRDGSALLWDYEKSCFINQIQITQQ